MYSVHSALKLAKRSQYALRNNAGLDAAEKQKQYRQFIDRVTSVLFAQSKLVSEHESVIESLVFLLPLVEKAEANTNLVSFLQTVWISFDELFKEKFGETALSDFYVWAATQGGQNGLDRMGIEVDFVLRNDGVTDYLKNRENLLIQSVDQTSKEQLARLIQEGRDGLLSNFEIGELINERITDIVPSRAETIAQSELANAFNTLEYETYKRNGVKRKRWVTVLDERVCPICEPLHNEESDIEESFSNGSLYPPAHPRCRCFIEEVILGAEVRGNGIVWIGD